MKRLTGIGILVLSIAVIAIPLLAQPQRMVQVEQKKMMNMSGSGRCTWTKSMGGSTMGMMQSGMREDPVCKVLHNFDKLGFYTKFADELGLSNSQVKKLEAIWYNHKKVAISRKADLKIAQLELKNILSQQPTDFKKANAKIAEIGSLEKALRLDHLQSIEKARKVLTPEQFKKLSELRKTYMGMKTPMHGQMMEVK